MTCFYAQPYDVSATGFYFESAEEYNAKRSQCVNDGGQPVEEFEIQFIDGEDINAVLFEAIGVNQNTFPVFLEKIDTWEDYEKHILITAVGECGYRFDIYAEDPEDFDVDLYEVDSLRELAEQFVDDGLFGDIPERFQFYIDYDAIARDLGSVYI